MAKGIEHESLCPCVSLNRYALFSCFPTIVVNKWEKMKYHGKRDQTCKPLSLRACHAPFFELFANAPDAYEYMYIVACK